MANKIGVFLSGGGGKGSFHIGFFKALEELGIKPDVICGSSAGAIVAAGATYLNSYEMLNAWSTLTLESVLNIDSSKISDIEGKRRTLNLWKETLKSCFNGRFLINIEQIEALLYNSLDEEKIRSSTTELGVTTTVLPSFKMVKIFKDQMGENEILQYVLASLYLPIFRQKRIIDGRHYIDIANLRRYPFEMLKERGCTDIYLVDIGELPVSKTVNAAKRVFDEGFNVNIISMGNRPSLLDFSKEQTERNYQSGYETTIKTLSKTLKKM